jgi:tellurite resistance protein
MNKRGYLVVGVSVLCAAGIAVGQGRIMDMVADKVVGKYQSATCEQLWQQKGQPKSEEEQRAVQFLKSDPQARAAFLNRVAGPIANKMFECGMIP